MKDKNKDNAMIFISKRGTGKTYATIIGIINKVMYEDLNPNNTDIPGALSHLQMLKEFLKNY